MCATNPSARAPRPPVCPTAGSASPLAVRLTDSVLTLAFRFPAAAAETSISPR
jgi:hypothetical protein